MAKLNEKKIKWIIREMEKGSSVSGVATIQKVSRRWVNGLYSRYKETGEIPVLGKPGRPASPPSEDVVDRVLMYHEMYGMGACGSEMAIGRDSMHVPHDQVHAILKSRGLARDEPNKQKRRWHLRYERPHSMDLWHADWYEHSPDEWWLVYEDDAPRLVTGAATDRTPTMDMGMDVFDSAAEPRGLPTQLLSDHAAIFWANPWDGELKGPSKSTAHLAGMVVEHIVSRVGRPEGNGKVERIFLTLRRLRGRFGSLEDAAQWYNESWPYSSLDGRIPLHDFYWKLPPERIFGFVNAWFWERNP